MYSHIVHQLITIVIRLVGSVHTDTDIVSLFIAELSKLGTKFPEMEASDFLVKLLGQRVDANLIVVAPNRDLCKGLICEAVGHHKAGMTSSTSKIDQTTLGEEDNGVTVRKGIAINLRLDVLCVRFRDRI